VRACLCFIGSLLTTCTIAMFAPAKGLGLWAPPQLLAQLPERAMVYFWHAFDTFYSGPEPVLRLDAISSVISFPSLHAAMGFSVGAIWRKNPFTLVPAAVWLAFMLLSTFPYGGHYLVDVLAGLLIAAGWFMLSRLVEKRQGRLHGQPMATAGAESGTLGTDAGAQL
jgi:membrane-associated phospholipid phosphatase